MRIATAVLVVVAVLAPAVASAQAAPAQHETVIQEPDKQVVVKRTHVDFSDSVLNAEHVLPESSYRLVLPGAKFKSLIKLRADFQPELAGSTDNLHN